MQAYLAALAELLGDRYRLERELGSGGMATVYLARDLKHDRWVAVKVLRPEVASALGTERFLREIRIAASLAHPYILPFYESGGSRTILYYVMPFVEGETLRQRLAGHGALSLDEAVAIARNVATALAHAHAQGIVHRDIKPANILIEGGEAVVADFGIARAVRAAATEEISEPGLAIGTPPYMSPEQGAGDAVDERSDIYSLGCVLYEMLVGEPPFTGPSAQVIASKHLRQPVPSVRAARPLLPQAIDDVIQTACAKAPADRYPNAARFLAALDGEAIGATRGPFRRRAQRVTLIGACTALAAAGAYWTWCGQARS